MYDLEMALLRQKLREKNTDIGLPTFHLNGCRYRPRIAHAQMAAPYAPPPGLWPRAHRVALLARAPYADMPDRRWRYGSLEAEVMSEAALRRKLRKKLAYASCGVPALRASQAHTLSLEPSWPNF